MRESARRFLCAGCGTEVFICTACDRGQRYCPGDCARTARRRSRCEANRRYGCTANGRLKSAARSQRYRDRQRVTDHGSLSGRPCGVLDASATSALAKTPSDGTSSPIALSDSGVAVGGAVQCSFCAKVVNDAIADLLGNICRQFPGTTIIHQTGKPDFEATKQKYERQYPYPFEGSAVY